MNDKIREIESRLDFIEFRQELLFNNESPVNRILFEYEINKNQYNQIMDLMDTYREKLNKNEKVFNSEFEEEIYKIVQQHKNNYHFVEYLTRAFMEERRWEEVFPALYGHLPKYKNILEELKKDE